MKKTILILGIIFLIVEASVVSSTVNRLKVISSNYNQIETKKVTKDVRFEGNIAYAYNAFCPGMPEGPVYFYLDDPGNITLLSLTSSGDFLSCGFWTNDWRWLGREYGSGSWWDINTCNGKMFSIGGGGQPGLESITYDPDNEKYYGFSYDDLYEIDWENGSIIYIGPFTGGVDSMSGIACDGNGQLYGWDYDLDPGTDNLWIIDKETAECSLVGPLGINIYNSQEGAFDYETDILYLNTYNFYTTLGQLYECNEDTGECTLKGDFEGGAELKAFVIPFGEDVYPPKTYIFFNPYNPNGENGWYVSNVTVDLLGNDNSCVNETDYRINGGGWDKYESSFILSEEREDILIEFYSVDMLGNVEDVKSKTLDIDKTLPELTIDYNITKISYKEWAVSVTYTYTDNTSGVDKLDIYLDQVLQYTVTGPGPTYSWGFKIKGEGELTFGAGVSDRAGNYAYKEILIKLSRNRNLQSNHLDKETISVNFKSIFYNVEYLVSNIIIDYKYI
jgi:hypothetical protein